MLQARQNLIFARHDRQDAHFSRLRTASPKRFVKAILSQMRRLDWAMAMREALEGAFLHLPGAERSGVISTLRRHPDLVEDVKIDDIVMIESISSWKGRLPLVFAGFLHGNQTGARELRAKLRD